MSVFLVAICCFSSTFSLLLLSNSYAKVAYFGIGMSNHPSYFELILGISCRVQWNFHFGGQNICKIFKNHMSRTCITVNWIECPFSVSFSPRTLCRASFWFTGLNANRSLAKGDGMIMTGLWANHDSCTGSAGFHSWPAGSLTATRRSMDTI